MKAIKYLSVIFLISTILLSSCNNDKIKNRQRDVANSGKEITLMLNDLYKSLKNLNRFYEHSNEYLEILVKTDSLGNKPDVTFETSGIKDYSDLSLLMSRVYKAYGLLSNIKIGVERSQIRESVNNICDKFAVFNLSDEEKFKIDELRKAVNSQKINRKGLIYDINTLFTKIIDKDLSDKIEQLDETFNAYVKGIKSIPNKVFDAQKLESLVSQPYKGDDVIVNLYKLQLTDEAYAKKDGIQNRIQTLQMALDKLNTIHAEFLKQGSKRKRIKKMQMELDDITGYDPEATN